MNFKKILFSLVILILISSTISWIFAADTLTFTKWFVGTTIVQFFLQQCITSALDARWGTKIKQLEKESIIEMSKNEQTLSCPCDATHTQDVMIRLGEDNVYICDHCQKEIAVIINVSTALVTKPLSDTDLKDTIQKISKQ